MSNVPTNLIPTRISQLPEAPVADPAGYFPIVISGTTYKVQFSQIQGSVEVPASRLINAGTGLTGGGSLSADITIAVANGGIGDTQLDTTGVSAGTYGDGANMPVVTVNTKGRVTSLSTTPLVISGYVPDSRQIVAGAGLSGGGNLSADRTLAIDFSSAAPQPLGSATAGTGTNAARDDHVHPAVDLSDATETQGELPMSRGGTGANLSPISGAIVYSNGTNFDLSTAGSNGQVLTSTGGGAPTWTTISGIGTVTSVSGSGGTTGLTVSGGPITAAGTLTLGGTLAISAGGTGLSGTPTNGQLLIGNGSGYQLATLTAGANVTITNATGSIAIAAAGDVVGPAGATSGAISLYDSGTGKLLKNSVITISSTGVISGVATPQLNTDAANKLYVDNMTTAAVHVHEAVVLATPASTGRVDTYNNGTSGVSATLTAITNGTLVIDSTVAQLSQRVLIKDSTNQAHNGIYVVNTVGDGSTPYVMMRSTDADTYGEQGANSLDQGSYFFVTGGTSQKGAAYVCNTAGVIDFGSTAITFGEFSQSQVYSAGNGLSLTATTFALDTPVTVLNGGTGQSSAPTNGQLLIGNGAGYALSTLTQGTGISVTNATGSISIANSAPDQTVTLTGGGGTVITGTYPSFTVSTTVNAGTVTSVDVSGGITGLTFSGGPVTSSGTITMAGTLAITNGGTGASTQSGARTALGLGTMAVQDANSVSITGGSIGSSVLVDLTNATGTISGGTY